MQQMALINSAHETNGLCYMFTPMQLEYQDLSCTYDCSRRTAVAAYTRASGEIGADVHRQAELVEDLFQSQREFLLSSCRGRAPSAVGTGPEQANKMKGIKALAQQDRIAHPAHLHVRM